MIRIEAGCGLKSFVIMYVCMFYYPATLFMVSRSDEIGNSSNARKGLGPPVLQSLFPVLDHRCDTSIVQQHLSVGRKSRCRVPGVSEERRILVSSSTKKAPAPILARSFFIQTFSVSAVRTGNESMATMRVIQQVTEAFVTNLCVFVAQVR